MRVVAGLDNTWRRNEANEALCGILRKVPDDAEVLRTAKRARIGAFLLGLEISDEIFVCDRRHAGQDSRAQFSLKPRPSANTFRQFVILAPTTPSLGFAKCTVPLIHVDKGQGGHGNSCAIMGASYCI